MLFKYHTVFKSQMCRKCFFGIVLYLFLYERHQGKPQWQMYYWTVQNMFLFSLLKLLEKSLTQHSMFVEKDSIMLMGAQVICDKNEFWMWISYKSFQNKSFLLWKSSAFWERTGLVANEMNILLCQHLIKTETLLHSYSKYKLGTWHQTANQNMLLTLTLSQGNVNIIGGVQPNMVPSGWAE